MASVRKRGESFQADVTINRVRYRQDLETEEAAWIWISKQQEEAKAGKRLLNKKGLPKITMRALADEAISTYWMSNKSADDSQANAEDVVKTFGATRNPATIMEVDIDEAVKTWKARGLSGGTINRKLSVLSMMFQLGYRRNWVHRIPTIDRERESKGRVTWYTREDETAIVCWFEKKNNHRMADLALFLIDTGLRVSEALALTFDNVSEHGIRVVEGKSASATRTVPATSRVKEIVAKRHAALMSGRIFPDLTPPAVGHYWEHMREGVGKKAHKEWVPHTCRHTFCSRLVQAGVPLAAVKELAGHSSIATTMRYSHLAPAHLVEAIRALESAPTSSAPLPTPLPAVSPAVAVA